MAARRAVVGADPDQPVDPALGLEIAIGVLALDQQRRRLDPGLLAGMMVDQFDLHPVPLGPAACTCAAASRPSRCSRCRRRRH